MIVAAHVIFGAYGFWLPNDPRGSWSNFVGAWELLRHGAATKTNVRRSVAGSRHNADARIAAKESLKYPPVKFSGQQARAVGRGFGEYAASSSLNVWACAILPNHVHLVLGRSHLKIEQVVNLLKGAATRRLAKEDIHPLAAFPRLKNGTLPKVFARGEWKVFLETQADIMRAIRYVEQNPTKEGLPVQRWRFVKPFPP